MSEKMTCISLPGQRDWSGYMDWGEIPVESMISIARAYGVHLRRQAEIIEAAGDSDFKVEVVRGPIVKHHLKTLQEGTVP